MNTLSALRPDRQQGDAGVMSALVNPRGRYRYCANANHGACNWLIPASSTSPFCEACRHNRTIPDLTLDSNVERWRMIEIAKHRLFYTILRLRLPVTIRQEDPEGLAFDFVADCASMPHGDGPTMTGHLSGIITINLAEADDAERERRRQLMGEPYRTLLGHFRHEIAHYYWDRLVANSPELEEFRQIFGDEREDYGSALARHYQEGPPAGWPERFVTAYATAHPWEDFAETWAHYFHLIDTLETAGAFDIMVSPRLSKGFAARIDFDPHVADLDRLITAWLPLTFAVNAINRSMGLPDLYPFILTPSVIGKLAFVHGRIRAQSGRRAPANGGIKAMIAGLRQRTAMPTGR